MNIKEYEIEYSESFEADIQQHKAAGNKSILVKIEILTNELREHPTTGTGKPEALKGNRKGQWSRRITRQHRLIYEINKDIVTVLMLTAWGHYDDK